MSSIAETASVAGGGTAIRIERVLCPVDFSEVSGKAYRYAQSIACHYRAKLILQHVVELWQHPEGDFAAKPEYFDEFRAALMSNAKAQLQEPPMCPARFSQNVSSRKAQPRIQFSVWPTPAPSA